ncbi:MAG: DNA-directed RNA polymerase subunit alpha C-terminal domain-containing protein [Patescibacteria group bacterium]
MSKEIQQLAKKIARRDRYARLSELRASQGTDLSERFGDSLEENRLIALRLRRARRGQLRNEEKRDFLDSRITTERARIGLVLSALRNLSNEGFYDGSRLNTDIVALNSLFPAQSEESAQIQKREGQNGEPVAETTDKSQAIKEEELPVALIDFLESGDLSSRTYRTLLRNGIITLQQAANFSDAELLRIRSFGRGGLLEIKKMMRLYEEEKRISGVTIVKVDPALLDNPPSRKGIARARRAETKESNGTRIRDEELIAILIAFSAQTGLMDEFEIKNLPDDIYSGFVDLANSMPRRMLSRTELEELKVEAIRKLRASLMSEDLAEKQDSLAQDLILHLLDHDIKQVVPFLESLRLTPYSNMIYRLDRVWSANRVRYFLRLPEKQPERIILVPKAAPNGDETEKSPRRTRRKGRLSKAEERSRYKRLEERVPMAKGYLKGLARKLMLGRHSQSGFSASDIHRVIKAVDQNALNSAVAERVITVAESLEDGAILLDIENAVVLAYLNSYGKNKKLSSSIILRDLHFLTQVVIGEVEREREKRRR